MCARCDRILRCRVILVVLFNLGLLGVSPGQQMRFVMPEDIVDIRSVRDIQIAPDGSRVAFVVTEPADPKKPEQPRDTNIWMVPVDGHEPARPYAASPKSETHPRWSPDGRYLAFLSDRGKPFGEEKEAKNQIYLLRTDGGEAESLTNLKGGVEDFKWSPDGKMIAFTVKDPLTEEEEKKQKDRNDEIYVDHDYKYRRLWVVSLADRKMQQVTKADLEVSALAWSADSNELALRVSATPRLDDVYWQSRLVIIRRSTGEVVRTICQDASASPEVRWSPDGQTIVFGEYTPAKIAEWLAVTPAAGGPVRYLLKDYPGTIRAVEWGPDSKHLTAESNEDTRDRFLRIDTTTGSVDKLAAETALAHADFTVSADGRTIAYLKGTSNSPDNVWVCSVGQTPRKLTDLNPSAGSWRLGDVKEVSWKSKKDGQTIYGVLVTPPDFKAGQEYPTIVEPHGGPEWAWWSGWLGSWHEWAQLLASHGYVVLMPNPRGSTGQGWKFTEANRDDWGDGDYQDIMDGVDSLITLKVADPQHLGVGGWSYGGFMTSWMVTQSNHFAAAIVGAGVTDLFSFDGTTDITPSFLRIYFLDLPFHRRADYDKHSPMTFLQNCRTPTLVLHGDADERVPTTQGWEFYNGLKMLGVPAEMVVYPREHHALKERAHQVDLLKRVLAWYDNYLKK